MTEKEAEGQMCGVGKDGLMTRWRVGMFQAKERPSHSCRGKKVQVQLGHCCLLAETECGTRETDSSSMLIEIFSSALSSTVATSHTCAY